MVLVFKDTQKRPKFGRAIKFIQVLPYHHMGKPEGTIFLASSINMIAKLTLHNYQ